VQEIAGAGNYVRNFTLWVQGSFPYGYGDLFGKGGPDVIRHQKHSGLLITGSDTKLYGCKLYMRSFGHGYYIQKNAQNISFENCSVEGESRSTDDILKETSGPAFDVNFRTWTPNREGQYIVTSGYMKSLCEDGFRTYGQNGNITFKNCTAKNTRGGFELRTKKGVKLENCTVIGTERGYWVNDGAIIKNCKGDANYGPLLFVEGSHIDAEIEVLPNESDSKVHALATIQGSNNKVVLKSKKGQYRVSPLPVLVGYTHPEHGEAMSPYSEAPCTGLQLRNETKMPVVLGEQAKNYIIKNNGELLED
jgi:parallel beta-helix repeat protein